MNEKYERVTFLLMIAAFIFIPLIVMSFIFGYGSDTSGPPHEQPEKVTNTSLSTAPDFLTRDFPNTDFATSDIDVSTVLNGGPGRDGIPAINDPEFDTVAESNIADEVQAIIIERNGEIKVYPYSILVWHEIVNDSVGDNPVAVTFCPLCGSALVFNPTVNGQATDFGVSGGLLESNMIMYDQETESLWQQATGRAVVGESTGAELSLEQFQLVAMADVRSDYQDALVLSTDTGFSRDYTRDPYIGYEDTEDLYFPTSDTNEDFPAKEIFVSWKQADSVVATPWNAFPENEVQLLERSGKTFSVVKNGSELTITDTDSDMRVPFYFEMWFSWSIQNQETGFVWQPQER